MKWFNRLVTDDRPTELPKPPKGPLLSVLSVTPQGPQKLGLLTPEQRADFEERAAIIEFDGHLSRTEAEQLAWCAIISNQWSK